MEDGNARRHREVMEAIARDKGVDPSVLVPLFTHLGQDTLTLDEIRVKAGEAVEAILERARRTVAPSNDGADIDATIRAARARLGALDTAGADALLADKIAEEETARRQRLIPLLEEQAAVKRLSYDHEGAKTTLRKLLALDPDRVWDWIGLGDLCVTTGALAPAMEAFRQSRAAAERLVKAEPGNADRQRDLSVSHNSIGDVLSDQGDLAAALASFQAGLAIAGTLARADPGNAEWQRDLAMSFGKMAMLEARQGATDHALDKFRRGREIVARLIRLSPDNAQLPKDLAQFDADIKRHTP